MKCLPERLLRCNIRRGSQEPRGLKFLDFESGVQPLVSGLAGASWIEILVTSLILSALSVGARRSLVD